MFLGKLIAGLLGLLIVGIPGDISVAHSPIMKFSPINF